MMVGVETFRSTTERLMMLNGKPVRVGDFSFWCGILRRIPSDRAESLR
jgi:hypothetical protein